MCTASAQSAAISTFTLTFWVFQIPHRIRYSPYRSKNEARATNKPQTDFIEFTQNAAIFIWHPFQFIHIIPVIVDDTTGRTYKTLHCKVISTSSPLVCRYRCGYGLGKESVTKKKYDRHQPQYLYSTTTTSFTLCLSTHWSWCYFSIINFHNDDDDDFMVIIPSPTSLVPVVSGFHATATTTTAHARTNCDHCHYQYYSYPTQN